MYLSLGILFFVNSNFENTFFFHIELKFTSLWFLPMASILPLWSKGIMTYMSKNIRTDTMFSHSLVQVFSHPLQVFSSPGEISLMSSSDIHVIWFPLSPNICIILPWTGSTLSLYIFKCRAHNCTVCYSCGLTSTEYRRTCRKQI